MDEEDRIKIKWAGPGWYLARYDENYRIICEKVCDYALTRKEAEEIADSKNVSSYSEPPAYMEVIHAEGVKIYSCFSGPKWLGWLGVPEGLDPRQAAEGFFERQITSVYPLNKEQSEALIKTEVIFFYQPPEEGEDE